MASTTKGNVKWTGSGNKSTVATAPTTKTDQKVKTSNSQTPILAEMVLAIRPHLDPDFKDDIPKISALRVAEARLNAVIFLCAALEQDSGLMGVFIGGSSSADKDAKKQLSNMLATVSMLSKNLKEKYISLITKYDSYVQAKGGKNFKDLIIADGEHIELLNKALAKTCDDWVVKK